MSVDTEVRWLTEGVLDDDPAMALACLRILADDYLPWLQRRAVMRARASGRDWARIARLLGRTRQTVRERFGGVVDVGQLLPPSMPPDAPELDRRERREIIAQLWRQRSADDAAATGELVAW